MIDKYYIYIRIIYQKPGHSLFCEPDLRELYEFYKLEFVRSELLIMPLIERKQAFSGL